MARVAGAAGAYARRVSFNERLYLAAERLAPGFCIQMVIEAEGEISAERLGEAVARAAEVNPGARLILRGVLGWARWVPLAPLPAVRVLSGWAPDSPPPPEVERPLCPYGGPTCELVLAPGPRPRIVFRCFHGVMDASGLLHFAREVFRSLRGEALLGAPCPLSDTEFVRSLGSGERRPPLKSDCPPLAGTSSSRSRAVRWQRLALGGPALALVAKIVAVLARHAAPAAPARAMIPVDLRNYRAEPHSTGNRTYPFFVDLSEALSWQAFHRIVLKRLKTREPLRLDPAEALVPWLPLWLLTAVYARWTRGHRAAGRFPFSALVTHLALPSAAQLSADGLACRSVYLLPPQSDFIPLCVSAVSSPEATNIVVSAPEDLLDREGLSRLCEAIRSGVAAPTPALRDLPGPGAGP